MSLLSYCASLIVASCEIDEVSRDRVMSQTSDHLITYCATGTLPPNLYLFPPNSGVATRLLAKNPDIPTAVLLLKHALEKLYTSGHSSEHNTILQKVAETGTPLLSIHRVNRNSRMPN